MRAILGPSCKFQRTVTSCAKGASKKYVKTVHIVGITSMFVIYVTNVAKIEVTLNKTIN